MALLALSAAVALAADRLATSPLSALGTEAVGGASAAPYMTPVVPDSAGRPAAQRVPADPFDGRDAASAQVAVAPATTTGSLSPTSTAGRRLTAILIADERRIAVIDDATVKVGDTLRDGARVASIQADRVWVSERNGRLRALILTGGGQ